MAKYDGLVEEVDYTKADRIRGDLAVNMLALLRDPMALNKEREKRATANFRVQVRLQLELTNTSRATLARLCGMSENRLSQILSQNSRVNLTVKTMSRIASALDCSLDVRLSTFMGQQCFDPGTKPIPGFEKEIYNF
jgi:DNA-binding Xre family transcriptional regulator